MCVPSCYSERQDTGSHWQVQPADQPEVPAVQRALLTAQGRFTPHFAVLSLCSPHKVGSHCTHSQSLLSCLSAQGRFTFDTCSFYTLYNYSLSLCSLHKVGSHLTLAVFTLYTA